MAKRDKIGPADIPRLLAALDCGDMESRQAALRVLCPCRNRTQDREVWRAICHAVDDFRATEAVRDQAFHALQTLVAYADKDAGYKELLDWLLAQGLVWLPLEKPNPPENRNGTRRKERERVTPKDMPRLMEVLACGDWEAQKHTLKLLCPCRNPQYDRHVWRAIFQTYEAADPTGVRDQAFHAIETLLTRARTDPRSQELLKWLAEQEVCSSLALEDAVPVWQPRLSPGLYIPRYERSPRSKANRRR
ncbi:MAG TPA: hypothetical protein VFB21_02610 [Chthonomonadaceae bacterium]|nr:hypothetical protein [Chthonomonadaceae bacterium]